MGDQQTLTALTADIAASFLANNAVKAEDVGALIASIYGALVDLGKPEAPAATEYVGAVSARQSLASRDKIISMIDGKPYSMLKRHLTTNGITPAEYRARYKLPADYPMIAPEYSRQRSSFAKAIGFGRKAAGVVGDAVETIVDAVVPQDEPVPAEGAAEPPVATAEPVKAKRGRKPAADTGSSDGSAPDLAATPAKRGRPRKIKPQD